MRPSGSDLRLLQVFDAVVRNGGFAAAEAELNLSQSTISNHMTALEQRLGVSLCQRGRRGFRLTEQGRQVHDAACRLESALQDFSADVGTLRGTLTGELRLAVLDAVTDDPNNLLPQALAVFRSKAPDVRLMIVQERPQDLQQKVRDGTYHCGIGVAINVTDGLEDVPLYTEPHGLYCSKNHPLFSVPDDMISMETLSKMAFAQRGYWKKEDTIHHGPGRVEATVYQIEPQLMLIQTGTYLGFLPHHFAEKWRLDGELRCLAPDRYGYKSDFRLFSPKNSRRTEVVAAFVDAVKQSWQSGGKDGRLPIEDQTAYVEKKAGS